MDGAAHALEHEQVHLLLDHQLDQGLVEARQVQAGARLARVDALQAPVFEAVSKNWKK